jgi:hypothetical protein
MGKFIITKSSLVAETLKGLGYFFVKHDGDRYYFINNENLEVPEGDKNKIAYTDILSL